MSDADRIIEQLKCFNKNPIACDVCNGRGFLFNKEHKAVECKCQKDKLLNKLYANANIPQMYIGMTILDDWDRNLDAFGRELGVRKEDKIKVGQFISRYIKVLPILSSGKKATIERQKSGRKMNFNSLKIIGGSHSGKTMIVSILCQEMINKAKTAKYYEWHNLSSILAEFRNSDSIDEIVDDFANKDFIVIDGVISYPNTLDTPTFIFNLNRISSTRLQSGKPIAITCVSGYTEHILRAQQQSPERVASIWVQLLNECFEVVLP